LSIPFRRCRHRASATKPKSGQSTRERGAETSSGDGEIGEIEPESAACSRSVYYPIAIGLQAVRWVRVVPLIGIGGHLAVPPLPHHRAYGSRTRRFD